VIFAVVVLLLGAVFNIVAWPQFLRRVAKDPRATDAAGRRTRFYTVHLVLVAIALVIAVLSVAAAVVLLVA
jgi:hypothetical protein